MKFNKLKRGAIISAFAIASVLPASTTMAAIPCKELDVIRAPDDMVVPMIYIELPISPSKLLNSGQPADRTGAIPLIFEDAESAHNAVQNQLRCLNYELSNVVMGNGTPEFRVATTARPDIEEAEKYVDAESAHLVQYGDVYQLEDGRVLMEYTAIIDGETFFVGEMVFLESDGELYLDQATLTDEIQLGDKQTIDVSERFTREVKIVEMENGDSLSFNNLSEEGMAEIVIKAPNGDTIFHGNAMADGMVGGETQNIFVAYGLEPGDYTATVSFDGSGVKMNITIQVSESDSAPDAATPELSTPVLATPED